MSAQFQVKANERGIVRLFSVAMDQMASNNFLEPDFDRDDEDESDVDAASPVGEALGVTYLDTDFVELFHVDDLDGVGLAQYMIDGLGIAEADITQDRARIDALKGHVLIVLSPALGGFETRLTPRPPLRWIATYVEESAPVKFTPLPDGGAFGATEGNAVPASSPPRPPWHLTALAGLGLLALILILLFATGGPS
ncbi:MAG: hypothetical protein CSA70_00600 [Rhodobacterales bacterium]|nr:MAG: hypothetical protein CSA70_00600 [Rhodobacterales bacterium]